MPKITFHGYSDYHSRNLCSIKFASEMEMVKFEINFKMRFSGPQIQAEKSKELFTTNIVYTNQISNDQINSMINSLL